MSKENEANLLIESWNPEIPFVGKDDLYSGILHKIGQEKIKTKKLVWLSAACFMGLFFLNVLALQINQKTKPDNSNTKQWVEYYQLNPQEYLINY
jgi:hypothetical protein